MLRVKTINRCVKSQVGFEVFKGFDDHSLPNKKSGQPLRTLLDVYLCVNRLDTRVAESQIGTYRNVEFSVIVFA